MFPFPFRAAAGLALATVLMHGAWAAPRYDHIVVVVMENHSQQQIVGSKSAPWITALSQQGANFTDAHAVAHPSQPNYLALFSGSTQGVRDDACPYNFAGANNLGAQLLASGLGFAGFSESMPVAGHTGCQSGKYVRKHNPWVDFDNVPAGANQPFSAFPADFSALPTVSFVVPDLANDMHDGSIKAGDTWLEQHIDPYAQWAKGHNSLLILTFDEDDYATSANQVATIFVGAGIAPGNYTGRIDHYSVLSTIDNIYGLPLLNPARPVTDGFTPTAEGSDAP